MELDLNSNWYVLQVITGKEKRVESYISKMELNALKPFLPKKKLKIKKKGKSDDVTSPLYPGYIFLVGEWSLIEIKEIMKAPNTVKIIGGTSSPGVLIKEEKELIHKITSNGLAGYSKAIKVGNKIEIISGPLKKLEGIIQSVDRRKQRAIVNLPLLNSIVKVTLGFEYIKEKDKSN